MSLLELFCDVDTFCSAFMPHWEQQLRLHGQSTRQRPGQLAMSEIMTILVYFHQMRFRDFKTYYLAYVRGHLHREFPQAVSYQRFVELIPTATGPLCAYLQTCFGNARASRLWTLHHSRSATIAAFRSIVSFVTWPSGENP